MNPQEFAAKWRALAPKTSERAAYQEHFRDLCALVGQPTPSSDHTGLDYAFEKAVKKAGTGEQGYADVFRRGHFIFEYKGKGKNLGAALQQALLYARELDNPPLLLVSDLVRIEVHTNFTGSSPRRFDLSLEDIAQDGHIAGDLTALQVLRAAFEDPTRLDPRHLRERVTQTATAQIGEVAASLQAAGAGTSTEIAHFLMRVVFAMFSEDVGLLERGLLTRLLEVARRNPASSEMLFSQLFGAMKDGGYFGASEIRHFNGGLFDDDRALPLTAEQIDALLQAARLDWAQVEPAIFGTLFEKSLDAQTRSKRGAHYTGVKDILRVVEPVVLQPLRREWAAVKEEAEARFNAQQEADELAAQAGRKRRKEAPDGKNQAIALVEDFMKRLEAVTVLDPACGSGNFLVVALTTLQDLEHEVRQVGLALGAGDFTLPPRVHPRQMHGIEIEPFARELASVSVWIAYFQWVYAHTGKWPSPVLQRLGTVENRDALLNEDGTEAAWPAAEFIVGNPPFLGDKVMRRSLGGEYVERLRRVYGDRLPAQSDLVCYWPEKARAMIEEGRVQRAGFVTTQSIRAGANRTVLQRIKETGNIFMAWPDEPWLQNGAAVRVSLFAFDGGQEVEKRLNGEGVPEINASLSHKVDVRSAAPLKENQGRIFMGTTKVGKFDISAAMAAMWLSLPNPSGVPNADVVKPWVNGSDIAGRPSGRWVVDFGTMTQEEAERYVAPFAYVETHVKPERLKNNRATYREKWWQHAEPRPALRTQMAPLARMLATPRVAKHRIWAWMSTNTVPDSRLFVVTLEDDFSFGVLHSHIHEWWTLANSSAHGVGNDPTYVAKTCFEPFPFPQPTAEQHANIEKWAAYLHTVREHLLVQDSKATLTGLYNALQAYRSDPHPESPVASLATAHDKLDQAVAAAYGWEWPLEEAEVLSRLLALNQQRSQ